MARRPSKSEPAPPRPEGPDPAIIARLDALVTELRGATRDPGQGDNGDSGGKNDNPFYRIVPSERLDDGVFQVGWVDYREPMDRFWALCEDLNLATLVFDYHAWLQDYNAEGYPWIETASLETLDKFLVAVRRGERFCEGVWSGFVRDGVFLRIAERLRELIRGDEA